MKKLHKEIYINAAPSKVYDVMLSDETYRKWTQKFNPGGSYFEGDWSVGSKMLFIGPSEDGKELGGMVSYIRENKPAEFVSIEHVGIVNNGAEDLTSDTVKEWAPSFENYTFTAEGDGTRLTIDQDMDEKYLDEFSKLWDEALAELKKLCE